MPQLDDLNDEIIGCEKCSRLRAWCKQVASEKRPMFADCDYWGKPVPNFGDPEALGLIVGLAPAAHGANRTGRMFTGDRSGDWLYRSLFRAGLANQAEATEAGDGLELSGVLITAVAHCAPPGNKPTNDELHRCRPFLQRTLEMRSWRAVLCLGGIAWRELIKTVGESGAPRFGHGVEFILSDGTVLLASYHPSQQNTFTGRLTEKMLDDVTSRFARIIRSRAKPA